MPHTGKSRHSSLRLPHICYDSSVRDDYVDSKPASSQPLIGTDPVDQSDSDESLFSVLDRSAKRYLDVDESYCDIHTTVVTDKDRHIEVLVAGERQDTSGIVN